MGREISRRRLVLYAKLLFVLLALWLLMLLLVPEANTVSIHREHYPETVQLEIREKPFEQLTTKMTRVIPAWKVMEKVNSERHAFELGKKQLSKSAQHLLWLNRNVTPTGRCALHFKKRSNLKLIAPSHFLKPHGTSAFNALMGKRPFELLTAVKRKSGGHVVLFGNNLPWTWKQTPVTFSKELSVNMEWGKYRAYFDPSLPQKQTDKTFFNFRSDRWVIPAETAYSWAQFTEEMPPVYTAVFTDVYASRGQLFTCDGTHITAGGCWFERHAFRRILPSQRLPTYNIVVPFCNLVCANYYHFTHEQLIRLAPVYHILRDRQDAVIVMPHKNPRSFHTQWLVDILGIPASRILRRPAHARVGLYPIPNFCYLGGPYSHLIYAMRDIVFDRLQLSPPPAAVDSKGKRHRPFRVLLAERPHLSRMPTNYNAIKRRLMTEYSGVLVFTVFDGHAHISKQVRAFYEADVVFGPHGANLANVLWMRQGAHIIEMISYNHGNSCFHSTASAVNVTHHAIFHGKEKDDVFQLKYELVKQHIEHAIASLIRGYG